MFFFLFLNTHIYICKLITTSHTILHTRNTWSNFTQPGGPGGRRSHVAVYAQSQGTRGTMWIHGGYYYDGSVPGLKLNQQKRKLHHEKRWLHHEKQWFNHQTDWLNHQNSGDIEILHQEKQWDVWKEHAFFWWKSTSCDMAILMRWWKTTGWSHHETCGKSGNHPITLHKLTYRMGLNYGLW